MLTSTPSPSRSSDPCQGTTRSWPAAAHDPNPRDPFPRDPLLACYELRWRVARLMQGPAHTYRNASTAYRAVLTGSGKSALHGERVHQIQCVHLMAAYFRVDGLGTLHEPAHLVVQQAAHELLCPPDGCRAPRSCGRLHGRRMPAPQRHRPSATTIAAHTAHSTTRRCQAPGRGIPRTSWKLPDGRPRCSCSQAYWSASGYLLTEPSESLTPKLAQWLARHCVVTKESEPRPHRWFTRITQSRSVDPHRTIAITDIAQGRGHPHAGNAFAPNTRTPEHSSTQRNWRMP
jgi:hypothetical protein